MITIVMATYNRSAKLPFVVENLLSQTHKDFEIVVVDDASGDDTPKVMAEIVKRYSNIRYFRNDSNRGPGYSRNYGVKMAKGDYIAIADDDDWYDPKRLQVQLALCQKFNACLVFSATHLITNSEIVGFYPNFLKRYTEPFLIQDFFYKLLNHGNKIPNMTIFGPKTTFLQYPYHEKHTIGEDWYVFLKIAHANKKIVAIPEPLVRINRDKDHYYLVKKQGSVARFDKLVLKDIYHELNLPKKMYYTALSNYLLREANQIGGAMGVVKWLLAMKYDFSNPENSVYFNMMLSKLKEKVRLQR